jgi:chromosome segregation ATPase
LSENIHLKSAKKSLEDQVSQLSESRANVELRELRDNNQRLFRELADEKNRSSQYSKYYQDASEYSKLCTKLGQLFPQFRSLDELANHIASLIADKEQLQKSKQNSDKRVQEIEQELQETKQKLSLATTRLRNRNYHSELGGGDSRSDQLKNQFFQLKSELHTASTKVLNDWQLEGFKSNARNDFKSEEFFTIKSTLSQRVFGDGMAYFAKGKTEVDAELHLVMDALSSIKDFSPTPSVFQEFKKSTSWIASF